MWSSRRTTPCSTSLQRTRPSRPMELTDPNRGRPPLVVRQGSGYRSLGGARHRPGEVAPRNHLELGRRRRTKRRPRNRPPIRRQVGRGHRVHRVQRVQRVHRERDPGRWSAVQARERIGVGLPVERPLLPVDGHRPQWPARKPCCSRALTSTPMWVEGKSSGAMSIRFSERGLATSPPTTAVTSRSTASRDSPRRPISTGSKFDRHRIVSRQGQATRPSASSRSTTTSPLGVGAQLRPRHRERWTLRCRSCGRNTPAAGLVPHRAGRRARTRTEPRRTPAISTPGRGRCTSVRGQPGASFPSCWQ
jgi:hypothetical protein